MRFIWLLLILFNNFFSFAQLNESFTDGDFTNNPKWTGDTLEWQVVAGQLNSNGPAVTGTVLHLSTPSTVAINAQWEFYANPKLATSSGNYIDVFLISDSSNLEGSNSGYFVRIGNTDDEVSLYLKQQGTSTKIIDGTNLFIDGTSNNPTKVRVTRSSSGTWLLEADSTGTGTSYIIQGTVTNTTILTSQWFGVYVKYSSTNFQKFFFDDFLITIFPDTTGPEPVSATVTSSNTLNLLFNEALDSITSEIAINYSVNNGIGNPTSAIQDSNNLQQVLLTFSTSFADGVLNTLTVSNIKDTAGNIMTSPRAIDFTYSTPAVFHDVVINEIMADQSPPVDLPEKEFIELYNRSNKSIDLTGWKFSDGSTTATLTSFSLIPQGYVIICANADTSLFKPFGKVAGVSSLPSLNNTGDNLTLKNKSGILIDSVPYTDKWYRDGAKDDGGWTLELINPDALCTGSINWRASDNPEGGTPGKQNSVFNNTPDNTPPSLLFANIKSDSVVQLIFSEPMDTLSLFNASYTITNGITVIKKEIVTQEIIQLTLRPKLTASQIYLLSVSNATDCPGNLILTNSIEIIFPEDGNAGDIIINEVLFDPPTGGIDFVEIYNRSSKYISLKNWKLANISKGTIASEKIISAAYLLIRPGQYKILSKDSSIIKEQYPLSATGTFINMPTLPSYNNDSGTVILLNDKSVVVDEFAYNDEMQFPLLNSIEGVSLERIDFNRPSNDPTNWHSAAESVGFATPGYKNSQASGSVATEEVSLSPQIFSPDNDGYNDVVNIAYKFDEPGYVANITIFDASGRIVKKLFQNELLGQEGTFSWDGINDSREKAPIGIYVIYFEAFNLSGKIKKHKKSCVLAGNI